MSKQNDLMFTLLENPQLTTEDFLKVGLSVNNTSLEDESAYKNLKEITENPLFQNANGEFDENKFHSVYVGANQIMQQFANASNKPQAVYSKYNIFAPVEQRDMSPQFELVQASNPDRITKSMITIGRDGAREYTPAEIAQSQQVYDSKTDSWMDTPENLFSLNKLFSDFTGFFTDNFGKTKVLAQYDEDVDINGKKRGEIGFDENYIEHYKGEYMLNDNGTYYYRTLKDGENIYGKQVLHYSDILTREGSALNSVDFLDSDDIQKSTFGSLVKSASLIAPLILGTGIIGVPAAIGTAATWLLGATIFQQATGLGATLGKIATSSDNPTMNWIEGLVEATNPLNTRSEYSSGDKMWTTENLVGMTADVIAQLAQQRMIFKWAPLISKGKWGVSEKTQQALKNKYTEEILAKNKNSLNKIIEKFGAGSAEAQRASMELLGQSQYAAAALVEDYMKDYQKAGEVLSKAYMTLLTVNDIYGEALEAGANNFDASLITLGYAAAEYALLSTDIGKWILPELRAARLENKAMVKALTKDTLEEFKKLGVEAGTSETAKRTYIQKLLDFGKSVAKGEFNVGLGKRAAFQDGEGLLKAGFGSLLAGASGEAVEETTEEVLADIARVTFNGLQSLKGSDIKMQAPWEDEHLFDRYAMSFLGGFLGGGISSATFDFSQAKRAVNINYNQAVQQLIWKVRNNDLDEIYKILDKEEIGNKNLSATKTVEDESGNRIWQQGSESDNQDLTVKNLVRRQIKLLQDTLEAHGGKLSDQSLLDAQTLKDIRFRALQNTTTAGIYIQKYNGLLSDLIDKTNQLRRLDSSAERIANGDTDEKVRREGESKEVEAKRKKLEEEIESLDKQIEDFNSGKLAPLFMASALLESTPFISKVFFNSSFKTFAENKAKTKYENIPEGELKTYLNEYQNYLRTSKKDDLDFATEGYLSLQKIIGQNFEEALNVVKALGQDQELADLLQYNSDSMQALVDSTADSDTWQEVFSNYVKNNPYVQKFEASIQLINNTKNESVKKLQEKHDSDIALFKQQLDEGTIDEEMYNNSVKRADEDFNSQVKNIEDQTFQALSELNTDVWIDQANQLADKFIKLGYINGSVKDSVVGKLNELVEKLENHLNNNVGVAAQSGDPEMEEKFINLDAAINTLKDKINQVQNLKYTPILQNLDQFALNLNGTTVSKVLEELNRAIQTNKTNIQAFTFSSDIHHAINEAERVIDLYIAALEGARTDTVDPFSINKTNVWGINKVLNEVHAKAPKIENDTWEDLPEIDGDNANMMLMDALSIKNTLLSYKKLFNINRGQKLEIQSRVGARANYLLYEKIRRLLTNADFPKDFEGYEEFRNIIENLKFFNDNVKDKSQNDWKISLNLEEQIALEKDRLAMEDAIYDFFNKNLDKLEEFFNFSLFKLGDLNTSLLTEDSQDIDESSFIGYLASKIAIKSSDFYSKYKELIKDKNPEHPIAPILGQELGVQLGLANILNGPIITKIIQAYRNSIYSKVKSLDGFKAKQEFLKSIGLSEQIAAFMATKTGFDKYFSSFDIIPQYSNITFVDGVAGSGKTSSIDATIIKYLQKYHKDLLTQVWTVHGGDSGDSIKFAEGLRTAIGLTEDNSATFGRDSFMRKLSSTRANLKLGEDGKSYEFETSDYKLQNGKVIPNWELDNISPLPTLIVIDEAQQFTQLDLLTIDKFARENGIPVIMSGDLQQSQMNGKIQLTKEDISSINDEIKANGITNINFNEDTNLILKLHRNQVLHTSKIGTSMRTENNQKNMNMAVVQSVMEIGQGNVNLHYFESDTDVAGDVWVTPNQVDEVKRILDKIFQNLGEGEKVNFAYYDENSEIYKALKADSRYWDKINAIKGIALGQEGNYWIVDINPKQSTESYLQDLYTGLTRAKKASIIVSDKTPSGIDVTYNNIKDLETHPEQYSKKAINNFIDKRVQVLEGALSGEGNNIPYNPRENKNSTETSSSEELESNPGPPSTPPVIPTGPIETPVESIPETEVITGGIATVAEDLKEAFNPTATAAQREIDVNNFLKKKEVKEVLKTYGTGLNSVEDLVNRAIDNEENEEFKQVLRDALKFLSSRKILSNYLTPEDSQLALSFEKEEETSPIISSVEVPTDEIAEESVSNEKETQKILSEANIENNSKELSTITIAGLSIKDFNFFLFSNASFEYGTSKVDKDNGTFEPSPIAGRIDSLNGYYKIFKNKNLKQAEIKLAEIRDLLMSVEDKADLEKFISNSLGVKEVYVRFAIKTSEFSQGGRGNFDKLDKEGVNKRSVEGLPYARAQVDEYSESNFANNRHIVAIIGTETTQEDLLEIPLITLNNPLSIILSTVNGSPRYPTVFYTYDNSHDYWLQYAQNPSNNVKGDPEYFAQVHALDDVIKAYDEDPNHQGIINLIKEYRSINRHITFIDDPNWTIGKNLHSFGPQINIGRGLHYGNIDYIEDPRWIPLNQLKADPQLRFTSIMQYTDKTGKIEDENTGELITLVSKPKHPFVLFTDSSVDHEGKLLSSDESIIKEFIWQKLNPNSKQTIKLVYVLPPKFTLEEYLDSLVDFMNNGGKFVLGNQRTPYKILEALIYNSEGNLNNDTLQCFQNALGTQTGEAVYNKVKEVIDQLKPLEVNQQIKLLTNSTPQSWNINGFGLSAEVQLYQQLQNVLKQLIYPTAMTATGSISHKGANRKGELLPKLQEIFDRSGLDMFFQTRGSKEQSKIILGSFSPIQNVDLSGNLQNDYIKGDKQFYVNGNLSTSTFMADEEFNKIIDSSIKKQSIKNGQIQTSDNAAYTFGYSGFNTRKSQTKNPSIHPNILQKLQQFGITTSVQPTVFNDTSIVQAIADEINSNIESPIRAFVLPNGELLIGSDNEFKGKQVQFNLGNNPFESQQSYMFDVLIDGVEYDAKYVETDSGKNLELNRKSELVYNFGEYKPISPEVIMNNIDKTKQLLQVLAQSSTRTALQIEKLMTLPDEEFANQVSVFINSPMRKALFRKLSLEQNFDFSDYIDMLEFEQSNKGCSPINIKFL